MKENSVLDKLVSDKRLAWRALSVLASQLPLMDHEISVVETPPEVGNSIAYIRVTIPCEHTLSKGPMVALGMLSTHADLLHPYVTEDASIGMEYVLNLIWTGGTPS